MRGCRVRREMATKLGIDDVGGVLEALSTIKNKWEVLGLQIGMHPNVLDGFKKEFGQNPDDCLLAVLKGHLRKFNPEPSWNLFVMALRSESVQEPVLAKEIAAKFCLEPQSPVADSGHISQPKTETGEFLTQERLRVESTDTDIDITAAASSANENSVVPIPVRQNQFPYLKLPDEMSEDARETFYGRLSTENREMQLKFQCLVNVTIDSLKKQNVTPEDISSKLMCCPTYEPQIGNSKTLLVDCLEEIKQAKSIDGAFFVMRSYFSFFNYELIQHIIQAYRLETTDLLKYEKELKEFCERRVYEFPQGDYGTMNSSDCKLIVHLDSEFEKFTLNSLRTFRHRLCEIIGYSGPEVRLINVKKASVKLEFAISASAVNEVFPLSEDQKKALQFERVKSFGVEMLFTVNPAKTEEVTEQVETIQQPKRKEQVEPSLKLARTPSADLIVELEQAKAQLQVAIKKQTKRSHKLKPVQFEGTAMSKEKIEFKSCIINVAASLSQEDAGTIVYLQGMPRSYRNSSPLEILWQLETAGVFSIYKIEGLIQILREINRIDLVQKVKRYTAKKRKMLPFMPSTPMNILEAQLETLIVHNISLQDQLARCIENAVEAGEKQVEELVASAREMTNTERINARLIKANALLKSPDSPTDKAELYRQSSDSSCNEV